MYGQKEATARISYMPYDMLREKEESIGIPIPKGKLWIATEKDERVTNPYTEGQIVYEGKNVTLGYAINRLDLEKGDERGRVLYTGDYGYFDEDNYFYIKERKDRQIKLFGNRIDLQAVEDEIEKRYGEKCVCKFNENKIQVYYNNHKHKEVVCNLVSKLLNVPIKNIEYIV